MIAHLKHVLRTEETDEVMSRPANSNSDGIVVGNVNRKKGKGKAKGGDEQTGGFKDWFRRIVHLLLRHLGKIVCQEVTWHLPLVAALSSLLANTQRLVVYRFCPGFPSSVSRRPLWCPSGTVYSCTVKETEVAFLMKPICLRLASYEDKMHRCLALIVVPADYTTDAVQSPCQSQSGA